MHAHLKYSAVTYNKKFRFCNLRYGGKNIIHKEIVTYELLEHIMIWRDII